MSVTLWKNKRIWYVFGYVCISLNFKSLGLIIEVQIYIFAFLYTIEIREHPTQ